MTNLVISQVIFSQEEKFKSISKESKDYFHREANFAIQLINDNQYLKKICINNPESLQNAIINLSMFGLSLNPTLNDAYLIPQGNKCHLRISYRGITNLAIKKDMIKYAVTKIVYENDSYINNGINKEPTHMSKPFHDNGIAIGVYCCVELPNGAFLTEEMSKKQIYEIRERSISYRMHVGDKSKSSPWVTDEYEMWRKTVLRRGSKSWPNINKLVDILEYENKDTDNKITPLNQKDVELSLSEETLNELNKLRKTINMTDMVFFEKSSAIIGKEIKNENEFNEEEAQKIISLLIKKVERLPTTIT